MSGTISSVGIVDNMISFHSSFRWVLLVCSILSGMFFVERFWEDQNPNPFDFFVCHGDLVWVFVVNWVLGLHWILVMSQVHDSAGCLKRFCLFSLLCCKIFPSRGSEGFLKVWRETYFYFSNWISLNKLFIKLSFFLSHKEHSAGAHFSRCCSGIGSPFYGGLILFFRGIFVLFHSCY